MKKLSAITSHSPCHPTLCLIEEVVCPCDSLSISMLLFEPFSSKKLGAMLNLNLLCKQECLIAGIFSECLCNSCHSKDIELCVDSEASQQYNYITITLQD